MTRILTRLLQYFALPIVLVAIWYWQSDDSTSPYFPPLRVVLQNFYDYWIRDHITSDILPSLWRMLLGFVIAAVVGVGLGLVLGVFPALERFLAPEISFARSIPGSALVPVAVILLGIGAGEKVGLIALVCLWPVVLNAIDGVRSLDPVATDVVRAFNVPRWVAIRRVLVPCALPQIAAGLKTSVRLAFVMMVVSEMFAASNGIGYQTLNGQREFDLPQMWSGIILLGLLGYLTNAVFTLAEKRILRWRAGVDAMLQSR